MVLSHSQKGGLGMRLVMVLFHSLLARSLTFDYMNGWLRGTVNKSIYVLDFIMKPVK